MHPNNLTFYDLLKKSHEDNGSFTIDVGEYWTAKSIMYAGELILEARANKGTRKKWIRITDDGEITYYGRKIPDYVFAAIFLRVCEMRKSFKQSDIIKNL